MTKEQLDSLIPVYGFSYEKEAPSGRLWMVAFVRLGDGWAERVTVVTLDAGSGQVHSVGANG